jgi:hypothetical protein
MSRVLNGARGAAGRGAARGARGGIGGGRGRGSHTQVSNGPSQVQPTQTPATSLPNIEAGVSISSKS